jgi:hypothetical protein
VKIIEKHGGLESFHNEILLRKAEFVRDSGLFRFFDAQYLSYMDSEDECYYCWLALAVKILKPRHVLELGSFTGGSAVCVFQELAESSRLTTIDILRDLRFCPPEMLKDPRVSFVSGNDLDLSIFQGGVPLDIDFLFIDTAHDYKQVSAEWSIYQHLLLAGALVVVDDIRLNGVGRFWEELPHKKLDISKNCHSSGFGIFVFEREIRINEEQRLSKALQASRKAISSCDGLS